MLLGSFLPSLIRCTHTLLAFRPTHDPSIDTFRVEYLIAPSLILALLFNYSYSIVEVFWSFSIFLESIAILPQLFILQRTGEAETITTHYLAALGAYRGLYIPNWIYRSVELAPLPSTDSSLLTGGLQLFCGGSCRPDLNLCRSRTDWSLPRLLLCVLHQVCVPSTVSLPDTNAH